MKVPQEVLKELKILLVETADDVLRLGLDLHLGVSLEEPAQITSGNA